MKEAASETVITAPKIQKIERLQTLEKEHKDALERAVSLNIPHAVNSTQEEPEPLRPPELLEAETKMELVHADAEGRLGDSKPKPAVGNTIWDEVVKKHFKRGEL